MSLMTGLVIAFLIMVVGSIGLGWFAVSQLKPRNPHSRDPHANHAP